MEDDSGGQAVRMMSHCGLLKSVPTLAGRCACCLFVGLGPLGSHFGIEVQAEEVNSVLHS